MSDSVVAIVGRPNVGKSTLFNRFTGQRKAIVEGEPNVTRDRIYGEVEWLDNNFILVDTGGIEINEKDILKQKTKKQAEIAMEDSDVILFVVDGRSGITSLDEEIANILRRTNKEVILVINKVENYKKAEEIKWEFYSLGMGDPITISAEHGKNTGDLLDLIVNKLPDTEEEPDSDTMDIAVVGKPNVGKSSLVNYILGQERVIVSDIPGTTRDAIDTVVEYNELKYKLIDTAGLRRKSRVKESVEYYSNIRSIKAIERSDAVLMMIDALEGVTEQDKKIAGYAHDHGKPIVIAVNKWDLVEKDNKTMDEFIDNIYYEMKFLNYAPITFISAITGVRVKEALELLEYVIEQSSQRVKTGVLNEVIQEAVQLRQPPSKKGKSVKIYYASQTGVKPPVFVFFVNEPELMHFAYERYLKNTIREAFGFLGSPIIFKIKQRT
ncbi:MAG TPA: ribosome biogenesis GTPase Der [Halanaerobiales bacterium]|nr:ribosome biogenesis GTPase Der [Halanaerobiales bacterium]